MIVMIALVAVVSLMPASAETLEVRGTVVELDVINPTLGYDLTWDYRTFAGFWYDMDGGLATETLTITATNDWGNPTLTFPSDRTLDEGTLVYQTQPAFHEYELHENEADPDRTTATTMENTYLCGRIGLCVESDNAGGDCGYFIEGWMAEEYVAIDNNADKLCKLLVEFEDDDKKTLATGEEWDIGGGFALVANQIDLEGDKVWFSLKKNGKEIDNEVVSIGEGTARQDRVYTYTADIGNEEDIPVFSCYVDAVFRGKDANVVQVKYVFLIDDGVLEIGIGGWYGIMEVMTASSSQVVLENHNPIDLDLDSTEEIMGNMYFRVADDDTAIRFHPFVEYTETRVYEIRGMVQNLVGTQSTDITWNAYNFAAFWYGLDDDLATETLTVAASTLIGPDTDRTIDENCLSYQTAPVYQEYELHENEGSTVDGNEGYHLEGWMGEAHVAINNKADKLCKLLVEFEDGDRKTLDTGDAWDMGGGFLLEAKQIDITGTKVWFCLSKDGAELDNEVVLADGVYTYTADIGGEYDVPVFSCYVDGIFKEHNIVQIKYVFLIDNDVVDIDTGDTYGVMEVTTASSSRIILENDGTAIDLEEDREEYIMGGLYFKTADDDTAIRFYPFGGAPPDETIPATDFDGDGVPYAWDEEPDTPAGYYTDSHGQGRKWGDMNGDGVLTSVDALMILQAAVGKIELG
jgi:S-layer protein (TIGR01567 family)